MSQLMSEELYRDLPAGTILCMSSDERHQIVLRNNMCGDWACCIRVRRDGSPYNERDRVLGWSGSLPVRDWTILADPRPRTMRDAYAELPQRARARMSQPKST